MKSSTEPVEENKVITQFLAYNPDRVQAIKHVTTQFKPEYISLEELQKMKDEHLQKMLSIENEFYNKKKKDQVYMENYSKLSEDFKHMESQKITTEELKAILKNENEYSNKNKKIKKSMKERARSARGIKRFGIHPHNSEDPLNKYEERYVKKFLNYKMKKELNQENGDSYEGWNTTKIKSQNANGVVNRPDGMPGHIDREDYSMYYFSISSNTPRSLSLKSVVQSRSKSHGRVRSSPKNKKKSNNKIYKVGKSIEHLNHSYDNLKKTGKANSNKPKSHMNSHLAFIKLIYNLLDKEKKGTVAKQDILDNMNLEEKILKDLGFNKIEAFNKALTDFKTDYDGVMTEQELTAFLLSRSDLAEEYLFNYINYNEEGNMKEENNYDFNNNVNPYIDGEEYYPGMNTHTMDFLNYQSTGERLEKLKESLSISHHESKKNIDSKQISTKEHNSKLTSSLKNKINNSKGKVTVSYKDYQDFLDKYQKKSELNFTIPKPFEFLKKDYSSKKMGKIQEILEEKKKKRG